jgi:hypothetical protein
VVYSGDQRALLSKKYSLKNHIHGRALSQNRCQPFNTPVLFHSFLLLTISGFTPMILESHQADQMKKKQLYAGQIEFYYATYIQVTLSNILKNKNMQV